jgi:hypothetical protein
MQRRNLMLWCGVAAAAGLLALLWWPGTADLPPLPAPPLPTGAPGGPAAPEPGPEAPPLPADAPRVVVEVRELHPLVAPGGPRITARAPGVPDPLPATVLAGVGGNPFVAATGAGVAFVAVELGEGARLLRQIAVDGAADRELPLGPRAIVRGLVCGQDRRPIAGAFVSLGELLGPGELRQATTDADGRFELDVAAGDGVPFLATAAGFAPQWRPIVVSPQGSNQFELVLPAAGELHVQLACDARELELARLFVVPLGAVTTELAHFPFFLQALTQGQPCDAEGRATVPALPRHGSLGLVVQHPGAPLDPPHEVRLAGATTRTTVPLRPAALHRIAVVDEEGQPVADVVALLRHGGRAPGRSTSMRLQPPLLDAVGCSLAFGGPDGLLPIAGPLAEGSVLGLRAPGFAGVDLPWPEHGLAEPLVLPRWRGGDASLRLLPPRPGVPWRSEWNLAGGLQLAHAADEPAQVALPRVGAFEVVVRELAGTEVTATRRYQRLLATGPTDIEVTPR